MLPIFGRASATGEETRSTLTTKLRAVRYRCHRAVHRDMHTWKYFQLRPLGRHTVN